MSQDSQQIWKYVPPYCLSTYCKCLIILYVFVRVAAGYRSLCGVEDKALAIRKYFCFFKTRYKKHLIVGIATH